MRPDFLRGIHGAPKNVQESGKAPIDHGVPGYRDLAKKALVEGEQAVSRDLGRRIALAAQVRGTDEKSQERIFDLQVEKQKVMAALRRDLDVLKATKAKGGPEKKDQKIPTIQYNSTEKIFYRPGKRPVQVTLGEIMTSGEWGLSFHLDETVPRDIRKQYILREAKRKIGDLLDEQIIEEESVSDFTHFMKRDAYAAMGQERSAKKETMRAGILAEKMVRNYLDSLSFDHHVSFSIRKADAYDDVEGKIDFIVEAKHYRRGVQVEKNTTDDVVERLGIQFTINTTPEIRAHKEHQAAQARRTSGGRVNDIVVVQIPLNSVNKLHQEWRDAGKPPGGPEKRWDAQTKEKIFRGVMSGVLSPEEMQEHVERIFQSRSAA